MRAITLHQPWASLIAIGAKTFETRSFPPPAKLIGQRIAIHAAVRPALRMFQHLDEHDQQTRDAIIDALLRAEETYMKTWDELPHGAVICTAVLTGAYQCAWTQTHLSSGMPLSHALTHISEHRGPYIGSTLNTDPFGDYSRGRWAWSLTDVQPLAAPIPAKGKQGWWEWEPSERREA